MRPSIYIKKLDISKYTVVVVVCLFDEPREDQPNILGV
jgi:hypothetical protein